MKVNLVASVSQWLSDSDELDRELEALETATAQQRKRGTRAWSE